MKKKENYSFFLLEWVDFSRCWNRIWLSGERWAWLFLCFKGKPDYLERLPFCPLSALQEANFAGFTSLKKRLDLLISNYKNNVRESDLPASGLNDEAKENSGWWKARVRFTESIMGVDIIRLKMKRSKPGCFWWSISMVREGNTLPGNESLSFQSLISSNWSDLPQTILKYCNLMQMLW